MATKTSTKGGLPEQKKRKLLGKDDLGTMWKPEKVGEVLVAKLVGVVKGKFGNLLKFTTPGGAVTVPQGTHLANVDFGPYQGQTLEITYQGKVGRGMKLFDVSLIEDETPF